MDNEVVMGYRAFNSWASILADDELKLEYKKYRQNIEGNEIIKQFVLQEIDLLTGFRDDKLGPHDFNPPVPNGRPTNSDIEEIIFIGRWKQKNESGLYVRFSPAENYINSIVLAKHVTNYDGWYYNINMRTNLSLFETEGSIPRSEIRKIVELTTKFDEAVKRIQPI